MSLDLFKRRAKLKSYILCIRTFKSCIFKPHARMFPDPSLSFSRCVRPSPLHPSLLDHPVFRRRRVPGVRVVMLLTFVSKHGPAIWPLPPHAGPPSAALAVPSLSARRLPRTDRVLLISM